MNEGGENLIGAEETISVCEIAWVAGWCLGGLELFDTSHTGGGGLGRGVASKSFNYGTAPQFNP